MKKTLFTFLSIAFLAICGLSPLMAQTGFIYTSTAPEIDGEIDEMWASIESHPITNTTLGEVTITSASWKAAWDHDSIYVLVQVREDTLNNTNQEDPWRNDNVEFFFDMNNSKNDEDEGYDDNDHQIRYVWGRENSGSTGHGAQTTINDSTGYILEVAFAWNELGNYRLEAGHEIGFDVTVADNDDGDRKGALGWNVTVDEAWKNPSLFGTVELLREKGQPAAASFSMTEMAPVVDGEIDELWAKIESNAVTNNTLGEVTIEKATWKAVWDPDSIYVLVEVLEDTLNSSNETDYENDNVEFFFDMNNSKNGEDEGYDDNDHQIRYIWGQDNSDSKGHGAHTTINDSTGYIFEVAFAWNELGQYRLESGMELGFDVTVADNDDGDRKGAIGWNVTKDEAWKNPSLFGTVELIGKEGKAAVPSFAMTDAAPVIDGEIEDMWAGIHSNAIENATLNDVTIDRATWKAVWDPDSIYVLVEVLEDTLNSSNETDYENDNVEFFFDMNNSKNGEDEGYDDNDHQIRYIWGQDNSDSKGHGAHTTINDSTGYIFEVAFAWNELGQYRLESGMELGFDVTVADNDDGDRKGAIGWNVTKDEAWKNPSLFGTVELIGKEGQPAVSSFAMIETAPVIDGEIEDMWTHVESNTLENTTLGETSIDRASWKAVWDPDSIYVLVEVLEDTLNNTNEEDAWRNDNVEFFFDMDNSKNDVDEGYDDNDHQIRYVWGRENSSSTGQGAQTTINDSTGYILEVAFAWNELGNIRLEAGMEIGFDMTVADNDDGTRKGAIGWNVTTDDAWQNPSLFGTVELLGEEGKSAVAPFTLTETLPQIDGEVDNLWTMIESNAIENVTTGDVTIQSASWKAAWSPDSLYVMVEVLEDTLNSSNEENEWQNDNVEFFFDMDNSKNGEDVGYDDNDHQIRYIWNADNSGSLGNGAQMTINDTTGYIIEVAFGWDELGDIPLEAGMEIGFDITVADNDDGERKGALGWNLTNDDGWKNPSLFGTVELTIPRPEALITDTVPPTLPELTLGEVGFTEFTVNWTMSEDTVSGFNSYILFLNGAEVETITQDTTSTYSFDALQLNTEYEVSIISMDNDENISDTSKVSVTTLEDAEAPVISLFDTTSVSSERMSIEWEVSDNSRLTHVWLYLDGEQLANVVKVTSTVLTSLEPETEYTVKLEAIDIAGLVTTSEIIVTTDAAVGIYDLNVQEFTVYPNPVTSELTIENLEADYLKIYNLQGKLVKQLNITSTNMKFDVSDISNGIYLIKLMDKENSIKGISRFIKK